MPQVPDAPSWNKLTRIPLNMFRQFPSWPWIFCHVPFSQLPIGSKVEDASQEVDGPHEPCGKGGSQVSRFHCRFRFQIHAVKKKIYKCSNHGTVRRFESIFLIVLQQNQMGMELVQCVRDFPTNMCNYVIPFKVIQQQGVFWECFAIFSFFRLRQHLSFWKCFAIVLFKLIQEHRDFWEWFATFFPLKLIQLTCWFFGMLRNLKPGLWECFAT